MPLSTEETITLEECCRNHEKPHFRNRCKSILMSAEKYSVKEIAKFFNTRTRTIYTWFNNWESEGIMGLAISPGRGVKSVLDINNDQHIKVISETLKDHPQDLGAVCEKIKEVFGFTVSKRTLKSFIKKKLHLEKIKARSC